ncbi:MAG: ribonuclease P protein component [Candidatus Paceibacterota bacterium]
MLLYSSSMLSKKNKVDKKTIEQIFKKGIFLNGIVLSFRFLNTSKEEKVRISFIVPKTVSKIAVKRNSLRRRGYAVLQKYMNDFPPGIVGVFTFKKYQDDNKIIENEIKQILSKIN